MYLCTKCVFCLTYPASKISSWRGESPFWLLRHIISQSDGDVTCRDFEFLNVTQRLILSNWRKHYSEWAEKYNNHASSFYFLKCLIFFNNPYFGHLLKYLLTLQSMVKSIHKQLITDNLLENGGYTKPTLLWYFKRAQSENTILAKTLHDVPTLSLSPCNGCH